MTRRNSTLLVALLIALVATASFAASAGAVPATGRISGTVVAEGGAPLEHIEVCAYGTGEEAHGCDRTRLDGTYEISGLPPGEYTVEFWSEGGAYVVQYWEGAPFFGDATPVEVTAGVTTMGIDAELEPSASISGTVIAAATGEPVQYVEACASMESTERCGSTDGDGEYTIHGLRAGSWNVYFYTYEAEADVESAPYAGGPVTLAAKEAKTGINAALVAGGQILGTVRSATTNSGVGGVEVCLTEADYSEALGCLTTGPSGNYRFYGIWPAEFKVAFSPEESDLPWSEGEPDAYPTQWWNRQTTFAAANAVAIIPPGIVTGVDALLSQSPVQQVQPITAAAPHTTTPKPSAAPLKCARGFVKHKVKGKQRCVKKKPKKKHKRASHKGRHAKHAA